MRESAEYQRSESHHQSSPQVQTGAKASLRPQPCYEHQRMVELSEATVDASQPAALCERRL